MNVGLMQLPKSAANLLSSMSKAQDNSRQQEVSNLLNQEDRYCGEVLTS